MGKHPKSLLAALAIALLATGCLDVKPKVLGQQSRFNFDAFNSSSASSISFNFALQSSVRSGSRVQPVVYLQAAANSKPAILGTCGAGGTGCYCEFLDSSATETVLYKTKNTEISYDEPGNYIRCLYNGSGSPSKVRIRNFAESAATGTTNVSTSVTLSQLIGDLDINRVRYVFEYKCQYTFLQKQGTTTQGFDCSTQATLCDTGSNFCTLLAQFPFYLFSDTYSTNFFSKISDKIYNGGQSGKICGLQIKQVNCVNDAGTSIDPWGNASNFGTPQKKFGLFGQLTGIWQTSVQLPAGPDQPSTSFGFAAKTSTVTGECPPGLVKRIFFTSNIVTTDIVPTHNFASAQVATEVAEPGATPAAFEIFKVGQGNCDSATNSCSLPGSFAGEAKAAQAYSSANATAFCVIPPDLLP